MEAATPDSARKSASFVLHADVSHLGRSGLKDGVAVADRLPAPLHRGGTSEDGAGVRRGWLAPEFLARFSIAPASTLTG
jgi:hypothetical protein